MKGPQLSTVSFFFILDRQIAKKLHSVLWLSQLSNSSLSTFALSELKDILLNPVTTEIVGGYGITKNL
jgi:hypothetical protein